MKRPLLSSQKRTLVTISFLIITTTCIFTSCNYSSNKSEISVENKTDTTKKDLHIEFFYDISEIQKGDSILRHTTDSLREAVKYIKRNRNISTTQRINRIKRLYRSIGVGSVWNCRLDDDYLDNISEYDLVADEIGLLLTDTNIVNYNLDSVFATIFYPQSGEVAVHSEDNRLWGISFLQSHGGNGDIPYNVIAWCDTSNRPQEFITSYSNAYSNLDVCAWWTEIHKLKNTSGKDLYLMLGEQKFDGSVAIVIELTQRGINLNYHGFRAKGIFNYGNNENNNPIVYRLGLNLNDDTDYNYKFNSEKQIITFFSTGLSWSHQTDTLIAGILTFNGKYFTEKLSKSINL